MNPHELAAHLLADQPETLAHSERVANRVKTYFEASVAIMHDVLEDTDADPVLVEAIVGRDIFRPIEILTRRDSETYAEYIQRIANRQNAAAISVKIADLYDHLALTATLRPSLRSRYENALQVLLPVASAIGVRVRKNLRR